jgi:hypothetical protein
MKEYFEKLSADRYPDFGISNTMNVENIFDKYDWDPDIKKLYITRFRRIPNQIEIVRIDCKKAHEWFTKNYQDKIVDCYFSKSYYGKRREKVSEKVCYFLFDDLLISLNNYLENYNITILYQKTDNALVDTLVNEIKKFKSKKDKNYIQLLVTNSDGLYTQFMEISKPKFSIEENYNDDFLSVHQTILNRLRKKNDKGLVLLHGKPGTGKTSYIRYLITKTRKPVIFLPPNMAASVTDPGLMNVLVDNPNSVFVIEDAENIIIDRNRSGSSSVSALLNLADGLLSDCLNIQIICSFNTDLSRVDSALTRKGRLIANYEFAELGVPKAQALSDKLGFSSVITSPMTLAAVYNQHETEFDVVTARRRIGFNIAG